MYRRIMVPLDESHLAEQAIGVGARLARASGGTLVLVEVVRGLAEFEAGLVPAASWAPAALEKDRKAAKDYLAGVASREDQVGTPVEIATYAGAAAPTLIMACRERQADAIVMTTHGRTGLARWALGSVAHKLVQHAPVPILLLRQGAALVPEQTADEPLRALVPLDGSLLAESVLVPTLQLVAALVNSPAHAGLAAVHLMRVIDAYDVLQWSQPRANGPESWSHAMSLAMETGTAYLKRLAEQLQQGEAGELGVTVTWSVVYDQHARSYEADVAEAILRTASVGEPVEGASAPSRCQLIALATHGRGGFSRWAMGSIADRVLQAGRLPMLLVGPQLKEEQALALEE